MSPTRTTGVDVVLVIDIPGTVTITLASSVADTSLVSGSKGAVGVLVEVAVPVASATLVSAEVTLSKIQV